MKRILDKILKPSTGARAPTHVSREPKFVELDWRSGARESAHFLRVLQLNDFTDVEGVLDHLRDRNNVLILKVKPSMVAEKEACIKRGGAWDENICRCTEKTTTKIKSPSKKEFWKQDLIKMDALSDVDINKYYPSRQSFSGNFMDPAYKDPTREIAAIGEQAQIASDIAAQMTSGP